LTGVVETLRISGKYEGRRNSPPACPTPDRINILGMGFPKAHYIQELGIVSIPTGVAKAVEAESSEHEINLGIRLIGKIFLEDFIRTHSSKI
jgi:hypothetical protein